jgi:Tfp pilus assembly protein PilZ
MPKAAPLRQDGLPPEDVLRRMRIPFIRRASLVLEGTWEDVFVVDLGLAGVFVERRDSLAVGTALELRFCLPDNETPITAACRVAWWHPPDVPAEAKSMPAGLGLAFTSLAPGDLDRIRQYLTEYYRREPRTRRFVSHEGESR